MTRRYKCHLPYQLFILIMIMTHRCFVHSSVVTHQALISARDNSWALSSQWASFCSVSRVIKYTERDPGYIVIIHIKYFSGPFHALDDLCDDLWPQTLLISQTWAGYKRKIQMISDRLKSSLLRLGSVTVEWIYFLNYCFAIVTNTECCDGCHLHLAQKAGSCLCLPQLSSLQM